MTISYWTMVAENIAKGLGPKTVSRLGAGGRILTRTGAVVGVGFLAYELFKSYKDNIEKEPAFKEMTILQQEMEKWGSAISCIGRNPYADQPYGSLDEGGAINALSRKKLLETNDEKPADPGEAIELIERAIQYITATENVFEDGEFEDKKADLLSQLNGLKQGVSATDDYARIRKGLSKIVAEIRPIESAYSTRIYDCSREIQKSLGSNAAWAAISMATLGLIKKPND
ncbi:MAG: hypothetical protein U9R43_16045 [Thermodesulfobacteriota bacterium]|nr:hypothetical protein [Thermodesulfobacteriota bacterium]